MSYELHNITAVSKNVSNINVLRVTCPYKFLAKGALSQSDKFSSFPTRNEYDRRAMGMGRKVHSLSENAPW
jgi:hypothetical protein